MGCATFTIRKGETFTRVLRWYPEGPLIYKNISNATRAAPCVLTATGHGVPDGWRIRRLTSVGGMKELNTHVLRNGVLVPTPLGEQYPERKGGIPSKLLDANTIELNAVNASSFTAYASGGVIEYITPPDFTSYTARMQIRDTPEAAAFLLELTTANGRIVLDNVKKTITLEVDVATIDAITWSGGVTTLELIPPSGKPKLLIKNTPVVVEETNVTR